MIVFEPTTDEALIRSIMTHPRVFQDIAGVEYTGRPEDYVIPMQPYILKLVVKEYEEVLGLLLFVPLSLICWEMHSCLLPNAWGMRSNRVFKALREYLWASSAKIMRVILTIPESNKVAIGCAERNNMDLVGINPNAVLRDGRPIANYIFGMSRPTTTFVIGRVG